MSSSTPSLTVLATGGLSVDIEGLSELFRPLEVIDLPLPAAAAFQSHRAEIHRAMDAASSPWILLLREREQVGRALAAELAAITVPEPPAWAARIRAVILYRGMPLVTEKEAGEIRLMHRRHCRFGPEELKAEGPVMRLKNPLTAESFRTLAEHQEYLRQRGVPHSLLRRLLLFSARAVRGGAWSSANTLRYIWTDAAWDLTGESPRGR